MRERRERDVEPASEVPRVPREDITLLTDAEATKAAIMRDLSAMVAGAKAGRWSHLAFRLSNHGTQVPDREGDEPDRADEAFCPHDIAQAGNDRDRNHLIVDDELCDLFVQLPPTVLLEVWLDTCHSGTGLKGRSPARRTRSPAHRSCRRPAPTSPPGTTARSHRPRATRLRFSGGGSRIP